MRAGVLVALAVGVIGWGMERARFGRADEDALARVERELRDRVDATADTLGGVAARVAGARATIESAARDAGAQRIDRKSTRLNSSHRTISYAVFCLKK